MTNAEGRQTQQQTLTEIGSLFRERLLRGDLLLGTFLKTPSIHATEILAGAAFDFVVVDQEHAPFDMHALDGLAVASRASGIPSLVRASDRTPSRLLGILELGYAGVVVPHICSVDAAKSIVQACRFTNGSRGYSNSPRAGGYGERSMKAHVTQSDRSVSVVAMIEDLAGVDALGAILQVNGIDAVLIGRADLAVAMGEEAVNTPRAAAQVRKITDLCRAAGKTVMLHVADAAEAIRFTEESASAFIVSSDQGLLRAAAANVRAAFPREASASRIGQRSAV